MTAPPTLPSVPGLGWSRHRSPKFNTRVATHTSGREVRVALQQYPLYEFEAVYDGLTSSTSEFAGLGSQSFQTMMGFFNQMLGQFGTFLYVDPDDQAVTSQLIAVGDNVTTAFQMVRTLGGFAEPVGWVTGTPAIYINGSPLSMSGNWSIIEPNTLLLTSAASTSQTITADFSYAYNCRFLDDTMDFEEFMAALYKLDSMKFRSLKSWL